MFVPEPIHIVIVGLMIVIPLCFIYAKAGFSPLWAGLVFLPGFGLFLIVLQLALMPWPNLDNDNGES
jgi:hypothetical protein